MRYFRKFTMGAVLMISFALGASPARAVSTDTAECELIVTITFTGTGQKMKSNTIGPTSPTYEVSVAQATDLDPSTAGTQACRFSSGGVPVFRSTSVSPVTPTMTKTDVWTCEAVAATGTWTQTWTPSPPAALTGALYTITGTWGSWEMTIRENAIPAKVLAVMPLTFATVRTSAGAYAASLASYHPACIDGSDGITQLQLFGVEVLQGVSA